jgi:O-antigen/teichoic acid export membrane protein
VIEQLRRLAQHVAVYGAGLASGRILQLIALPVLTLFLTSAEYGVLAILAVFGLIGRSLFGLGLGQAVGVVFYRAAGADERAELGWAVLTLAGILAVVFVGFGVAAADPVARIFFGDAVWLLPVLLQVAFSALQMVAEPMLYYLQSENRPWRFVAVSQVGGLLGLGFGLVAVLLGFGVPGWLLGNVLGAAATLVMAIKLGPGGGGYRVVLRHCHALLRAGVPFWPGLLLTFILLYSSPYFVGWLKGLGEAGIFSVGYQLGLAMGILTGAFGIAWYPYSQSFAQAQDQGSAVFPRLLTGFLIVYGFLLLLVFALAKPAVALLAGPEFLEAWRVVGLIAASQLLFALWNALLPGVYFSGETVLIALIQGLGVALAILGQFVLVPYLGGEGAALAVLAALAIMILAQIGLNRRYAIKLVEPVRAPAILALTAVLAAALWLTSDRFALGQHGLAALGFLALYAASVLLLLRVNERKALWLGLLNVVPGR